MLHRFLTDESGATSIEYALIAAIVSIFAISAMNLFAASANNLFYGISDTMDGVAAGAG